MRISKIKLALLMVMSLFGLAASSAVLIIYYFLKEQLPGCVAGQAGGIQLNCNLVLQSRYSQVFGIPLELFAVVYFIINLVLVYLIAFGSDSVFRRALNILFGWRFIGLLLVPYLVFIEVFILQAICVYCTVMHISIIVDFVIISYLLFYRRDDLLLEDGAQPQAPM